MDRDAPQATRFRPFPLVAEPIERLTNYELFLRPNGVYRARQVEADNYLYPMYALPDDGGSLVSTSVYALIHAKRRFIRNPRFQSVRFYRPSFTTIDQEIQRVRTAYRRSTYELTDPEDIITRGAELIQAYVTDIERRYPQARHILLMGGKDSENIILAKRTAPWVVVSGEPNAALNQRFLEENRVPIERFIAASNDTDDTGLLDEILASDCFYDVAHFRWTRLLRGLVQEVAGRAVIWIGTSGDGIFARNCNHRDCDYYAVHDLHVGMAMGIWHQMLKNLLNVPVVSPYQSPRFLDELFYRFDPHFVARSGDVRAQVGARLLGRPVWYPAVNPCPAPWRRDRGRSIPCYVQQLERDGIPCRRHAVRSRLIQLREGAWSVFETYSAKRRSRISRILFPLRRGIGKVAPALRHTRFNIAAKELR